jgi:ribose transport system ATP-binding protein
VANSILSPDINDPDINDPDIHGAEALPGGADSNSPLLQVRGLTKRFSGNTALDRVSFDLHPGEVLAVVGHNGSGKSTLVKVLGGVYTADEGEITFPHGPSTEPAELHIIHQDLGLAGELNAIENIDVARNHGWRQLLPFRLRREQEHARRLIQRFGAAFDLGTPIRKLDPAQRAVVGIARALDGWKHNRNVLILDEPTEALHAREVAVLFESIRKLAAQGAGIIFISHRLDEVLTLADRVVVLRDGAKVADQDRSGIEHAELVEHVAGIQSTATPVRSRRGVSDDRLLHIRGLSGGGLHNFDIELNAGEVVGIAGVLGSGRESVPGLVFGRTPGHATAFDVKGAAYRDRTPRRSIKRGIAYVPADRAHAGSIRPLSARENLTLPDMDAFRTPWGSLRVPKEKSHALEVLAAYGVRPPNSEQMFSRFSGGNQQKIIFGKWLRIAPDILVLEEPTQGVDVGAKGAIYQAIDAAAEGGMGILVCSSEAKELVRLCDRVIVLRDGSTSTTLAGAELIEKNLILSGYGLDEGAQRG